MKAIKIDVIKKEIYHIDITDSPDIYNELNCNLFTCPIYFANGDTLYVDDEGLLKPIEEICGGFWYNDQKFTNRCYFGNGLLIGTTIEGDNYDVQMDINRFKKKIRFMSEQELRWEYQDIAENQSTNFYYQTILR